jgi:hypothetical protein
LYDGEDVATCPSCTLRLRVIFEEVREIAPVVWLFPEEGKRCCKQESLPELRPTEDDEQAPSPAIAVC